MAKRFFRILLISLLASVYGLPVHAQTADNKKPIEITAQQTIEWLRDKKQYVARGDVLALQGEFSIRSELLEADYRETTKSNFDIYRMTATDHVRIISGENTAQGEKAVYDIDRGLATLTGGDLRLSGPGQTVTAKERFEYWVNEGRLTAIGGAKAVRGEDIITARTISAFFQDGPATGNRALSRLEAEGDVIITTPTEVLHGDRGTYDAKTTIAGLKGNVSILRGPNKLEGDSADVNMTTNISRMHGSGAGAKGRVRGVFYPDSQKSADKTKEAGTDAPVAMDAPQ